MASNRGARPLAIEGGPERAASIRLSGLERLRRYGLSHRQLAWLFFLPSAIVLAAVLGYPAVRTTWMSLHTIRLDEPWIGEPFVGLKNYATVLQSGDFWGSLSVSAYFTAGSVVAELLLGLCVALVVNESF